MLSLSFTDEGSSWLPKQSVNLASVQRVFNGLFIIVIIFLSLANIIHDVF